MMHRLVNLFFVLAAPYPACALVQLHAKQPHAARARPARLHRQQVPVLMTSPSAVPTQNGRIATAVLAAMGALETSAITYSKLFGKGDDIQQLCPLGNGCADVLNGPWSEVGGVPLAAVGAVAYASVCLLALAPTFTPSSQLSSKPADAALLGLTAAMASFSGCLMLLLAFEIQTACSLCIASAALSVSMFALLWRGQTVPDRTEAFVVSTGAATMSFVASAFFYFSGTSTQSQMGPDGLPMPPAIQSHSSADALAVARRMKAMEGRMFGAYWCSHCINQKEIMGREAMAIVPYIECDEEGSNSQRELCVDSGIRGYPTWQLKGELFPGEKNLEDLRELLDRLDSSS